MIEFDAFVLMQNNFVIFDIFNIVSNKQAFLRNSNASRFFLFHSHFTFCFVNLINDKTFLKNFAMNFLL